MKFKVGKNIIVEGYERKEPGIIEEVGDDYILVRYPFEDELKKYYINWGLIFYEDGMFKLKYDKKQNNTNSICPDLSKLTIEDIYSYNDIENKCATDDTLNRPGIYAWFFKECLLGIPDKAYISTREGLIFKNKWRLRYIGKATGQTLKERVWDKHFNGSASVSTLRDALGSLLSEQLSLHYIKLSTSHKFNNEEKLTQWLKENARVYYYSTDNSSEEEKILINKYAMDLYLNLKDNEEIFQPLKKLKKNLKTALSNNSSIKEAILIYKEQAKIWHERGK